MIHLLALLGIVSILVLGDLRPARRRVAGDVDVLSRRLRGADPRRDLAVRTLGDVRGTRERWLAVVSGLILAVDLRSGTNRSRSSARGSAP
jgi:hypothetical protein